ncbi:MAG: DUF1631 domain-containing protein [Pseudomonadota bacterium]|nr:DUF1631 domain-containing protein [Pseudomonadota bacterium]
MVSRSTPDTPVAEAPASPRALVEQLVALAVRHVGEHLVAVAQNISGALLDLTAPDEAKNVYQRVKSGNLLKQNSYAFVHIAASGIEAALRREAALLTPPAVGDAAVALDALSLALVPMAEMDSKVAFGVISRPFDIAHAEQLATLNVRLAHLLDRDILRSAQNPFRPEVFLAELDRAWCEFEPDASAHGLIQPLLVPALLFDFGALYDALGKAIKRSGRQPAGHDKRQIRKTDDAAANRAARATSQAALSRQLRNFFGDDNAGFAAPSAHADAAFAIPMIPDLPAMPQGGSGWRPSAATAFGTTPAPALHPATPVAISAMTAPAPHGSTVVAGTPVAGYSGFAPAQPQAAHAAAARSGQVSLPAAGLAPQAPQASQTPGAPGLQHMAARAPAHIAPLLDMLARLPHLANLPAMHANAAGTTMQAQAQAQAPAGTPGHPANPGEVFYLPRLKQSLPEGSLSRGDESTLDLLSRIFETVFLDEAIPAPTRELIQSLQMPVLKAALVDKNFFFEETHPARRMIDLLSRMGWDQRNDPDDPLFQTMERNIRRIGREGASDPAAFADAVADLEQSIAAEESALDARLAAPVAVALRQEHIAVARRAATDAIQLRIAGDNVVPIIGAFLENKWRDVLTLAYDVEDKKPGAVNNATRAMDDLVWSVKPKATHEQRRALLARLPGLLTTINKWLDIIKWQDEARLKFFAALAECHASIVRAPIDLSPERQLELAVEAAQQDAMRLIAHERAAAEQLELDAADPVTQTVEGLERGRWMAFAQPDGKVHRVKLAWVSPRRTLFIFSAGAREEAFSMTADLLVGRVRDGSATILAIEGVVGRVLSEVMQQAAENDASDDDGRRAAA